MDRDVNAFQRIVGNQGGNEKAAGFWSTFRALEQYSNLFDCLHDTEDEMIKLFMELGCSNSELKQLLARMYYIGPKACQDKILVYLLRDTKKNASEL